MPHPTSEQFSLDKALKNQQRNVFQRYFNIDKYFFHPLASWLAHLVFPTRITPNQLTYFSFFWGLAASLSFASGSRIAFVYGGVFCLLSAIVDNADGMLARSRGQCSEFGSYLDLILDRINDTVMITAIGIGAFFYFKNLFFLILGLATSAVYGLQIIIFYLTKNFLKISSRGETGITRDFAAFVLFICALFGKMNIAIYLLAAQAVLSVLIRTGYFISLKNHNH